METTNVKFIKTDEKVTVQDYPWGFKLRCTLYDSVEFNSKKGYRYVTQTVDPRTGNICKPKKTVYYTLLLRYYKENGHISYTAYDFNGAESINKGCKFVSETFSYYSPAEITYLYEVIARMLKADFQAQCIYAGCKPEDIKEYYLPLFKICEEGHRTGANMFEFITVNIAAIEKHKPEEYNPFKVTSYAIAGSERI